jgi:outer membrane lipoprotein-sorting protein
LIRAKLVRRSLATRFGASGLAVMLLAGGLGAAVADPLPPRRPADLPLAQPSLTPRTGQPSPASPALVPTTVTPSGAPLSLRPDAGPPPATTPSPAPMPAVGTAAPAARPPATEQEAVQRLNDYLNSMRTLIADFVQFGADGRRYQGKLYLQRPGRMRFEYQPPATIEVISDGTTVAVRDKRLATQDNFLIGQTPLKFLTKDRIDLARDAKITRVINRPDEIRVTVEDRSTLGGTSRITIHFDPKANQLVQWVIIDPQGYETSVQVANLDTTRRPDPSLFRINLERVIESR